jgi:hypothetical protein
MAAERFYLETGQKKVVAASVAWPGWCRIARDERTALGTLVDYGPRYGRVVEAADLGFEVPSGPESLTIVERVAGGSGTDYGAPSVVLSGDYEPVDAREHERLQALLAAYWAAFDRAVVAAAGKTLRKGPRGGGREVAAIVEHVVDSESGYLKVLGWTAEPAAKRASGQDTLVHHRQQILAGLAAAVAGKTESVGPRGGKRWPPRYFVRRVGWHVLDHLWEIEDRVIDNPLPL